MAKYWLPNPYGGVRVRVYRLPPRVNIDCVCLEYRGPIDALVAAGAITQELAQPGGRGKTRYDANGNNNNRIRKVKDNYDPNYTTTYLYDKFNRLTNATATAYGRTYQFDPWGNITNFAGVTLNYATSGNGAPSTNRINTDSQSYSYSYDAAGNMTAGMGQSFTYDGANRLKTAGNGSSSYGYDGDGMRVFVAIVLFLNDASSCGRHAQDLEVISRN